MHQSSTSSDSTDKGNVMQYRHRFAVLAFVIALTGLAAVAPAAAHAPNHVYVDESGSPCWVHSDDPFGFHWVLADTSSSVCRTTFASDAEWIYSFNAETGAYQRSANGLVCTAAGGCDDYAPPAFQHPDCDQLTDDDWVAWWTHVNEGRPLTDEQAALYLACYGF